MARKDKSAPAATETQTSAPTTDAQAAPAAPKNLGPKGTKDDAVITMLTQTNPKREGSAAKTRFAAYVDGMTIKAALAAGVTTPDLVYDAKHGFISIDGYTVPGGVVVPKPKAEKVPKEPKAAKVKAPKVEKTAEQVALEQAAEAEAKQETME